MSSRTGRTDLRTIHQIHHASSFFNPKEGVAPCGAKPLSKRRERVSSRTGRTDLRTIHQFDLHIHSNHSSDGILSPTDIYTVLRSRDYSLFSITDHNTVSSVREILSFRNGDGSVVYIPAVELSTYHDDTEIHLIPYGIDPDDADLTYLLEEFAANRLNQARLRTDKLKSIGFRVDFDRVIEAADGKTPSGVTFLKVLAEYDDNLAELQPYLNGEKSGSPYTNFYFDYFFRGGRAYVDVSLLDYRRTVAALAHKSVLVVAHPGLYPQNKTRELFIDGVEGIEVYSSYHNECQRAEYLSFAAEKGLLVTAGSDFHGERIKPSIHMGGHGCEDLSVPTRLLEKLAEKNCSVYRI
ncbi:phosphatase [Geovibrio thiophilus]|uniref:Phosphatase n=1 Tax=Geovibrio thiophilus TaxID=139438 RepID=A0A3R5UYR1_9BACT|nr:phosphatase [Geovibrio thiophilus]QAR33078.1 phosphatase [Geovibrio thiophilus]